MLGSFHRGLVATVLGCALLSICVHPTFAQEDITPPTVTTTYALENAKVVQAPGQVIESATVIVRDGIIRAVGPNADVPYDAHRLAADSLVVYAGFIDGLSHAGVTMPKSTDAANEEDEPEVEDPGNPPPDAAGIQPDRSVRPLLSPDNSKLKNLRKIGFTAGHVVPKGQMLPGSGAYILYGGTSASDMVLERRSTQFAQIEPASGYVYPATEMAVLATFRQLYREAQRRQSIQADYNAEQTSQPRPPSDPIHRALMPVLRDEMPLAFYADDALPLHRVLNLQENLGFPVMLAGLGESFRALDALRNTTAPLFLTLNLPTAPDVPIGPDTTVADTTKHPGRYYDPTLRTPSYRAVSEEETNLRLRHALERRRYQQTAATLHEAGLQFGFTTRAAKPADIRANLRTMIEHGLPEETALAALTTRPASLLGLDNQLGTVEEGKIANLVVTDGPYFSKETNVHHVFVDGRMYIYASEDDQSEISADASILLGTWTYTLETSQGEQTGTLSFEGDQSSLMGTLTTPNGDSQELESISFDGSTLTFDVSSRQQRMSVTVTVDGDTFEGSATIGTESFPISGKRTNQPN